MPGSSARPGLSSTRGACMTRPMTTRPLFVTPLYEASLAGEKGFEAFIDDLHDACIAVAEDDEAGQAWAEKKGYLGYTSYASLDDLAQRDSLFADLKKKLDKHAAAFAKDLRFDLAGGKLVMDSFWINILEPGGQHSGHIHPHSVISGTVYVTIPPGASALKFEDPRLPMMMAAPAPGRRAGGAAAVRLCPARAGGDPDVGELAAPRGDAQPGRGTADQPQLQLRLALRPGR